jgi:hypothetical protein
VIVSVVLVEPEKLLTESLSRQRPGQPKSFKRYSFKKSFLYRLRVDKRIENKKHALSAPDNMHHNTWLSN